MKKIILQMLLVITSLGFALSQTRVTGKVVDVSGQPLDYVSVLVKEFPSAGTYTDDAGNYTINVPTGGKTLIFGFIGYKTQEVIINSRSIINITLESDAAQLEEIVVMTYDPIRKSNFIGTASTVHSEAMVVGYATAKESNLVGTASAIHSYSPSVSVYSHDSKKNESYISFAENRFKDAKSDPLSTFSLDVDIASYTNVIYFSF